jgi:hypothetical protein
LKAFHQTYWTHQTRRCPADSPFRNTAACNAVGEAASCTSVEACIAHKGKKLLSVPVSSCVLSSVITRPVPSC